MSEKELSANLSSARRSVGILINFQIGSYEYCVSHYHKDKWESEPNNKS